MNAIDLIAAAKDRRTDAGLVANNGIACRTQAEVDYYNFRDAQPRDENGLILMTPELRAMKKAAGK
jgi:hypothetical protein